MYLCVLCGSQNKQLLFPYTALTDWFLYNRDGVCLLCSTNWVFICNSVQWWLYVPSSLTFTNSAFCPHSVFLCFVWIWEQTAIISLYSFNWLVFVTETECEIRTGSLYIIQPDGNYMYHQINIHKLYVLPTHCIYVFCVDLRTNSHYFPIQH